LYHKLSFSFRIAIFRSTHSSFESYCKERFGYGRDYADLKIKAAKIYQNLKEKLPTIGRQIPLPTNERQVRALVKSRLPAAAKLEVWQEAVKIAKGKIPSGRTVKEAVEKYQNRLPMKNLVRVGQICRIVAGDSSELRGKGGCWGIIAAVEKDNCTIDTWDNEYILHPSHLQPLNYNEKERRTIEELGVRMTRLWERGQLEGAAMAFLKSLAKIDRPYLTELEEMWLEDLEGEK
jgi:hypothetical protein